MCGQLVSSSVKMVTWPLATANVQMSPVAIEYGNLKG